MASNEVLRLRFATFRMKCCGGKCGIDGLGRERDTPLSLRQAQDRPNLPSSRVSDEGRLRVGAGADVGDERLYAKLEFLKPTGSFKDRGSAVMVSSLRSDGIRGAAEDLSGNAGASVAAYCAKAGIEAKFFAAASEPSTKLQQISFYGARTVKVWGGRSAVAAACRQYCKDEGMVYASQNLSPLFIAGTKIFATEVASQMEEGTLTICR